MIILLPQEAIYIMITKKRRKGFFVIKVDMEKVYDILEWDFIEDTLSSIGLGNSFSAIIMACICFMDGLLNSSLLENAGNPSCL